MVIVIVAKTALTGASWPFLPEVEILVNSFHEVVVVVAVGAVVVEIVLKNLSFQVIVVVMVAELSKCSTHPLNT